MKEDRFRTVAHADLLQPTLSPDDDGVVFNRPWNPRHLMLVAFFGGFAAGGILALFNEDRLDLGGRRYLILGPLFFLVWLCWIVAVEFAEAEGVAGFTKGDDYYTLTRIGKRLLAVFLVWLMTRAQRQRFKIFEQRALEAGSILGPALGAIVMTIVFDIAGHAIVSTFFESNAPGGTP